MCSPLARAPGWESGDPGFTLALSLTPGWHWQVTACLCLSFPICEMGMMMLTHPPPLQSSLRSSAKWCSSAKYDHNKSRGGQRGGRHVTAWTLKSISAYGSVVWLSVGSFGAAVEEVHSMRRQVLLSPSKTRICNCDIFAFSWHCCMLLCYEKATVTLLDITPQFQCHLTLNLVLAPIIFLPP